MAQYSTTARTITLVISVQKMKSGLLTKTEFAINFTWWTDDAFSKYSTVKLMFKISILKLGRLFTYLFRSKCYFATY